MSLEAKRERAERCNAFLCVIASCGRRFFQHAGRVSRFEVNDRGRIFFRDGYTGRLIYTHDRSGRWRGFTEGGTLRTLVQHLHDFIRSGDLPKLYLGPWPDYVCNGDLWGYGADMETVRVAAAELTGVANV